MESITGLLNSITLFFAAPSVHGAYDIMNAFNTAVAEKYRLFSFGDAMLIVD